jgi:hypothetical protein
LNNYYDGGTRPFDKAIFHNSIIYGNNDNEITLDTVPGPSVNYLFNHCLIKTDQPTNGKYVSIQKNVDPLFSSFSRMTISNTSSAIGAADNNFLLFLDIDENTRSNPADIGSFEYVP